MQLEESHMQVKTEKTHKKTNRYSAITWLKKLIGLKGRTHQKNHSSGSRSLNRQTEDENS